MPRKKKAVVVQPSSLETGMPAIVGIAGQDDGTRLLIDDLPSESLLDQALVHYDLHRADVFIVRSIASDVVLIITRDARKFTYPAIADAISNPRMAHQVFHKP